MIIIKLLYDSVSRNIYNCKEIGLLTVLYRCISLLYQSGDAPRFVKFWKMKLLLSLHFYCALLKLNLY